MQTKVLRIITILVVLVALVAVCAAPGMAQEPGRADVVVMRAVVAAVVKDVGGGGRGGAPPLIMTSTAWEDGGVIPDKYTQKGGQMGPEPGTQMDAGSHGHTEFRSVAP